MARATTTKTAETPPDPNDIDTGGAAARSPALAKFCAELLERFPHRLIRRHQMPASVRDCREVFLVEMTSREEVQAAIMADATMSDLERRSMRLTADAERRECIRLSIVGIGMQLGPAVAYRHANHDGIPLNEISDWTGKAWTSLHAFFGTLNGIPQEEIAEGLLGAETVGAFAPPTSGIPASAERGR